jgi:hypothetical protein
VIARGPIVPADLLHYIRNTKQEPFMKTVIAAYARSPFHFAR